MKYIYSTLLILSVFTASGQHSVKIDSLSKLLDGELTLKERGYVLDDLSYEWFTQNLDSSLVYGQEAYRVFEKIDDPFGFSRASTSVAVAYHYKNDWDSAQFYYEKALTIRTANNLTKKAASSLNNLGVMFMDRQQYNLATEYYLKAMKLRESLNDSVGVATTKFNLGLIYKKQGNIDKAIANYTSAKSDMERLKMYGRVEVALLNLGALYNEIEDYQKGKEYSLELKKLAKKRESKRNLAKSHTNLANALGGLGELDSAQYYAEKAMQFFEATQDSLNIGNTLLTLAQISQENGDFDKSVKYGLRLESVNAKLHNKELKIENQLCLSKSYSNLGLHQKAYNHLKQAYLFKDSLLSESANKAITDLTLKYESEQKEKQIAQLKVTNQEVIIEKQKSSNQRNIFMFLAALFVVGAMLLWLLLKTKSKALLEKEILLKEIHHRVKNNLQVISSLLSLQSRFIEDKGAKEVVSDGQNRVKSMALIHQKLYQKDNLTGVEALEYIENLISALRSSYGINNDQVNIKYDIDTLNVDIDTIIPIGLILNELISNSFKYAFPDNRPGILSITFKEIKNKLMLVVKDDGVGLKSGDFENSQSFGIRMINSLARKLEADINFNFDRGTEASLMIANYKLV